ncbi:unnamed protein product [Boreogadus saida]
MISLLGALTCKHTAQAPHGSHCLKGGAEEQCISLQPLIQLELLDKNKLNYPGKEQCKKGGGHDKWEMMMSLLVAAALVAVVVVVVVLVVAVLGVVLVVTETVVVAVVMLLVLMVDPCRRPADVTQTGGCTVLVSALRQSLIGATVGAVW